MKFYNLLIEYWAQTTILIFAIGYVLRTIFEFQIKKKEIRFNFIHKERAEVIKQLHLTIIELSSDLKLMALAHTLESINQGPTDQERKELFHRIVNLNNKVHDLINRNKILFSKIFVSHFDTLVKNVNENFIFTSLDKNLLINDDKKDYIFSNSKQFLDYYENEFSNLQDKLQNEFKKYL